MFVILRLHLGSRYYETYHTLKSVTADEALKEAADYLSDGGAPAAGDPGDTFEVAQIISHPVRARHSFLAATQKNHDRVREILLRILKEGE